MVKLRDVCRNIRSKNAGPFWVTIDIFFDGPESFQRYSEHDALGQEALGRIFGVDPALVKRFPVASLDMVKLSYPRTSPQGGVLERDLHAGQQFVRLLPIELG